MCYVHMLPFLNIILDILDMWALFIKRQKTVPPLDTEWSRGEAIEVSVREHASVLTNSVFIAELDKTIFSSIRP